MTGKARMTFRFDRADPRLPGKERPSGGERLPGNQRTPVSTRHPSDGVPLQDDVDLLERLIRGEDSQVVPLRPKTDKPAGGTLAVSADSGIAGTVPGSSHVSGDASGPAFANSDLRAVANASVGASDATKGASIGVSGAWNGGSVTASGARTGAFDADCGSSGHPSSAADSLRPELAANPRREGGPPPSGIRVFLAVAGAVATGALFGYLVLWLFAGQPWISGNGDLPVNLPLESSAVRSSGMDKPEGQAAGDAEAAGVSDTGVSGAAEGAPAGDTGRRTAETAPAPPEAGTETMAVPADLFYFLQYGVFSSEERMKEALRTVRNKGLAAVAAQSDGYRVYVGAAATRDDAERLAKLLGDLQVYIKVLDNPPLLLPADGPPVDLPVFFERSGDLARQLARLSLALLREGGPPPEEDWQRLQESHRQWRQAVRSLEADPALTGNMQTLALRAAGRLEEAVTRLEDGRGGQDRAALWDAQSAVMEAWLDLDRLRETLHTAVITAEAKAESTG